MPKRGRKKKFRLNLRFDVNPDVVKSVISITLVLLGALGLLSFFAPDYELNAKVNDLLREFFGFTSILVPFILIFSGLLLVESIKLPFKNLRVLFGMLGILFSFAGLLHLYYLNRDPRGSAQDGLGGGLIGFKLSQTLSENISMFGGFIVLASIAVLSGLLVFNVSLDQVFSFITKVFEKIKNKDFKLGKKESGDDITFSETTSEEVPSLDFGDSVNAATGVQPVDNSASENPVESSFEVIPSLSEPTSSEEPEAIEGEASSLTSIAPGLPYSDRMWELPPLDLLAEPNETPPDVGNVKTRAKIITDTLKSFGVGVEVKRVQAGPSVTQYALEAESGTKISKIASLQYDLALALASPTGSVRIEAPIPGESLIGIEVPNNNRATVYFKPVLTSDSMKGNKSKIATVLGKDVGGQTYVYDIGKMPHMLVAGATGSGKSVFLHSLIFSILYRASPQECKFIFIDPKRVELAHYQDIPHLLVPVVTEIDKAASVFKWAVAEMERRYKLLESAKARNIDSYNEKSGFQAMPYIIIIVDELAEIMVADPAAVEKSIIRIAQLARATGIHLILSVQRPSTNVITGLIKANIPCRAAFNVSSQIDSRVIIDQPGAEKLLGKGDMLFMAPDASKPVRLQGAYVSDREISNLVSYLKAQGVEPKYKDDVFSSVESKDKSVSAGGESVDELFDDAVEVVQSAGKASASLLQRRLSVGYARAARILDELEEKGVVGPSNGSRPRDVLVKGPSEEDMLGEEMPTANFPTY